MAITIRPNQALARYVFPDGFLNRVKNGVATNGAIMGVLADAITAKIHEGRPYFHFWGGHVTADDQPNSTALFTIRHKRFNGGGKSPRGTMHALAGAGLTSTTAGIYAYGELNNLSAASSTQYYPDEAFQVHVQPDIATDDPVLSASPEQITLGSDSIILTAGCLYERTVTAARPEDCVLRNGFAPGADILADQTNNYSTDYWMVATFTSLWQNRRPEIGWSAIGGTYCDFSTSSQQFRYWGDQSIGTTGTAPSNTGPGDTLPVLYAGAGRRTTIRVYVAVYAAMSGATNQGTLAIANRDTSGTMGPFVQIGSSGMITGSGFQWYPSGTFDPSTAPYFESPTNQAYDRVLLGAKSNGATDTVRIAAWKMFVYHSTA